MEHIKQAQWRTRNYQQPPHVCVVGAGVAGLRCADKLLENGFQVTILEARDRIGGRVCQMRLPSGQLVDLGPNWIHGTDNNPILDLAKQTDTVTHSFGDIQANVFDESGNLLSNGKELYDKMWGIINQAFTYSTENTTNIDPQKSLFDFFTTKLRDESNEKRDAEEIKTVMQMSEMWGAFVGSPITTQSLKFFWLEECIDGENLFCAGTYQNIVNFIAKPALQSANTQLSTRVTKITTSGSGVNVQTENGQSLGFDEVVMTVPLGWLQQNKTAFHPKLPDSFSEAIDGIGYGCLEKVYITFPRAFWLGAPSNPDVDSIKGFIQWVSPNYAKLWNQETIELASLPRGCSHPTLLFYLFGQHSRALASALSVRNLQQRHEYLTHLFSPYFSRLPYFSKDDPECVPLSCVATTWVLDDLAGNGSYSNFQTGLERGDEKIETMREGLPERRLWFAGEHTAPFIALGTVTGAYWSGDDVAKRISAAYKVANDSGTRM